MHMYVYVFEYIVCVGTCAYMGVHMCMCVSDMTEYSFGNGMSTRCPFPSITNSFQPGTDRYYVSQHVSPAQGVILVRPTSDLITTPLAMME